MSLRSALRRLIAARKPIPASVAYDAERIVYRRPLHPITSIAWAELAEVGILTTDDGPASDDVLWILLGADVGSDCAIPSGTTGMDALLGRLQQLPGFDNMAVVQAMGSTSNASFVCWRRAASGGEAL